MAGCGGGGAHLARSDAAPLIRLADKIPLEPPCAQARDIRALNSRLLALVDARKIPPRLREPLSSGVNALVAQTPPCLPPLPAVVTEPSPTITIPEHGWKHRHGHGRGGRGGD